ncbi:kinase-like domain-containing protein [Aspergillus keveii]|uniref:Serine/threonine-protein kinase ATG1 n=1 Tax=Aspergillus keveii TaxID=714993 RepID=A0ABR4FUV2_9EURO
MRVLSTVSDASKGPLPIGASLRVLAARTKPLSSIYRALGADGAKYIIKDMIKGEFDYQLQLQRPLSSFPNVRSIVDTIKEREMFVYSFLAGDLLRLGQRPLSTETRRHTLRDALQGLVDLHALGVLHNDIKPNNILIDFDDGTDAQDPPSSVRIADLEDAVIVPPGKWLRGPLCGNALWRSPESWSRYSPESSIRRVLFWYYGNTALRFLPFSPAQSTNSAQMIYAMVNEMVFRVPDSHLNAEDSWLHILFRHISYFGDEEGVNGLLEHIGEANNPRQPLEAWRYLEPDLRDLIGKMTRLDPKNRITAKEALDHPWFGDRV